MTSNSKSIVLAGVAVLSWATVATAFKIALRSLSVFDMLLVSTVTAMAIFAFMMTVEKKWWSLWHLSRTTLFGTLGLGVLNPVLYIIWYFSGRMICFLLIAMVLGETIALGTYVGLVLRESHGLRKVVIGRGGLWQGNRERGGLIP